MGPTAGPAPAVPIAVLLPLWGGLVSVATKSHESSFALQRPPFSFQRRLCARSWNQKQGVSRPLLKAPLSLPSLAFMVQPPTPATRSPRNGAATKGIPCGNGGAGSAAGCAGASFGRSELEKLPQTAAAIGTSGPVCLKTGWRPAKREIIPAVTALGSYTGHGSPLLQDG